jgi:hypothetical protein
LTNLLLLPHQNKKASISRGLFGGVEGFESRPSAGKAFKKAGLPEPIFEELAGGLNRVHQQLFNVSRNTASERSSAIGESEIAILE